MLNINVAQVYILYLLLTNESFTRVNSYFLFLSDGLARWDPGEHDPNLNLDGN